jgi:hypothetical protein
MTCKKKSTKKKTLMISKSLLDIDSKPYHVETILEKRLCKMSHIRWNNKRLIFFYDHEMLLLPIEQDESLNDHYKMLLLCLTLGDPSEDGIIKTAKGTAISYPILNSIKDMAERNFSGYYITNKQIVVWKTNDDVGANATTRKAFKIVIDSFMNYDGRWQKEG